MARTATVKTQGPRKHRATGQRRNVRDFCACFFDPRTLRADFDKQRHVRKIFVLVFSD